MAVTIKNFLRRPITVQYPEQRLVVSKRERGTVLAWSEQACTGCYTCSRNCPHGCITIETGFEGAGYTEQAPCTGRCPAHVDAARYIRAIIEGQPEEAVAVVRERIPFPSVCAYICAHPCESACNRGPVDEPIAIRMLKRYAVDNDDGTWKKRVQRYPATGSKVAVVGAGPAGLTAAYYLARKGHSVTVFEALAVPGGMVKVGIPDYRLAKNIMMNDIKEIEAAGVYIRLNSPVDSIQGLLDSGFQSVLCALGAHEAQSLGVPGEDDSRVLGGVAFLRQVNLKQETKLGKRVAVIGGGNTAMDCARAAVRLGATDVSIIYRRTRAEMPAAPEEIEEAMDEGIKFIFLAAPVRAIPEGNSFFLENVRMKLGAEDASGRRRPEPIKGSEFRVELDNVIAAISQSPVIPAGFGVATDKYSRINVDKETMATSLKGVYAAGDVVLGPATVIEAIAQGRVAAESIDRYLGGDGDISENLAILKDELPERTGAPLPGFRPERQMISDEERKHSFEGVEIGWNKEQAELESARCLRCDMRYTVTRYQLESGLCIYCGLCVESCPFNALFMATDYERWSYRLDELTLQKSDIATPEKRKRSAYAHPELEADLPEQTLLIYGDKNLKKQK
jgi:formate dehydrogenase beta subunit